MINSLGPDLATCWRRLIAGDNGIAPISYWDPTEYITKVAAEVRHIPNDEQAMPFAAGSCRRGVRLFSQVAQEAFADAQLDRAPLPLEKIGLAAGASVSYINMGGLKQGFRSRKPNSLKVNLAGLVRDGGSLQESGFYRRFGDMMAAAPYRLLKLGGPSF